MSGYFGIGIYYGKSQKNIGTLWRSALLFGASYVYTINARYKWQPSDTHKSWRQMPFFYHSSIDQFLESLPFDSELIGVELTEEAINITDFKHPKSAIYLLGSEDTGLQKEILDKCSKIIKLPGKHSLNVSTAGSLVMYDRYLQMNMAEKKKNLALQK